MSSRDLQRNSQAELDSMGERSIHEVRVERVPGASGNNNIHVGIQYDPAAQASARSMKACAFCATMLQRPLKCGRCHAAYCDSKCQRKHWRHDHKAQCRPEPWQQKVSRRTRRQCRRLGRVLLAFGGRMRRWMRRMRRRLRRFVRRAAIEVLWGVAYVVVKLQRIVLLWRILGRDVHA